MVTVTSKELSVLVGITKSDFFENGYWTEAVYLWSVTSPFVETPSMGGIVASLVKKGLVESQNLPGDENMIWLTAAGVEVLKRDAAEAVAYFVDLPLESIW